jgi:hypothetical protein
VIIAVAGRRIDAIDTKTPRFPLENVPDVEHRLDELFERATATAMVASAACGADLLALTVAGKRGMRRRVVLPFSRDKFRTTSVTDRPGNWGPVYDRVLADLDPTGDVVTLEGRRGGRSVRGGQRGDPAGSCGAGSRVERRSASRLGLGGSAAWKQ